ncbi:hypothetical protein TGME49_326300, partial [Toxoplasma gondii ME49]
CPRDKQSHLLHNMACFLSFVADISYKYGQEAAARGVKLVSFCGIDSLPSDLAVALIQREALRRRKMPCHEIKTAVTDCFGGFSGSAVVGLGQLFEEGAVFDPFFLVKYAAASPPSHVTLNCGLLTLRGVSNLSH